MDQGAEKSYKNLYDFLMALPKDALVYCNMPLEIGTAEGIQLAIVANEDREALIDAGIDPEHVDSLKDRAGAFAFAAANYQLIVDSDPKASKLWKEYSPAGHAVQSYLIKHYAFAFRKNEELTKSVNKIKEGRGDKDMLLDLLTLNILGKDNLDTLSQMKMFDKSKIDEAKDLHERLSDLYARFTIDPKKVSEAKVMLDRAYTYFKLAADEVKDHGTFVFEGTDRHRSYVSDYHSGLGKKSAKAQSDSTPQL